MKATDWRLYDFTGWTFERAYAARLHKQYVQFVKHRTIERLKAAAEADLAEHKLNEEAYKCWSRLREPSNGYVPASAVKTLLDAALLEFFAMNPGVTEWRGAVHRVALLLHEYDAEQTEVFGSRLIKECLRRCIDANICRLEGNNHWSEQYIFNKTYANP